MGKMGLDPLTRITDEGLMESSVVRYLSFEIGIRGLKPCSIKQVYLGGISNYFVELGIKNAYDRAVASKLVKFVLRGYDRIYAAIHPESGNKKVAFTIELSTHILEALKSFGCHQHDQWKREAILFAIELGIYFLLRKSEYLPTSSSNFGRQWKHVKFFAIDGREIPWGDIGRIEAAEVLLNIDKSKMDQFGRGRLVRHKAVPGSFCIVKKTVAWAVKCRDHLGATQSDYIFKVRDRVLVNDIEMAKAMRQTFEFVGISNARVSAHSLRYGGATMLAAAGLPQYVIAFFGGWTADSKSLRRYMQLGAEAVAQASKIMAAGFGKSLAETRARAASIMW